MGFNSRTLGRVRLVAVVKTSEISIVSIHAPWEGCDNYYGYCNSNPTRFNSRTLGRVRRPRPPQGRRRDTRFQFTHPGKGATNISAEVEHHSRVSIHAPWEGCDPNLSHSLNAQLTFQFTHPGKGATEPYRFASSPRGCFNSRTLGRVRLRYVAFSVCSRSFNSRTLGRVRRSPDRG